MSCTSSMHKTFESSVREKLDLNGIWDAQMSDSVKPPEDWSSSLKICVPGCWNDLKELYSYEGVVWYKREFALPYSWRDRLLHLCCGGASYESIVWLNTQRIHEHNGLCSFWAKLPKIDTNEKHTLFIRIDNRGKEGRIGLDFDWQNWGGVFGDVFIQSTSRVYFEDIRIENSLRRDEATINVGFNLTNLAGEGSYQVDIQIVSPGNDLVERKRLSLRLKPGENVYKESLRISPVELWSTQSPNLYGLKVSLKEGEDKFLDEVFTYFGLRTVACNSNQFLLNGEPMILKGLQVMNSYPDFGLYLPQKVMLDDFKKFKELNVNLVRTHYPVSEDFLRLADEFGIMVVESIPFTGPYATEEFLIRPRTMEVGKQQLTELIKRDELHPSIVSWGVWNEIDSEKKESIAITEALVRTAKAMDSSRMVTFASNRYHDAQTEELCLHLSDLACINLFCGWYNQKMDDLSKKLDKIHSDFPSKPILITEFGFGAIPGHHSIHGEPWSEEYQAKAIEDYINILQEKDYIIGSVICAYSDWKTYRKSQPDQGRTRQHNNKGIVDEYRTPKLGYYALKRAYSEWPRPLTIKESF